MQKIDSFEEVKFYLTHNQVVTTTGEDSFFLKDGFITHKFEGNTFKVEYKVFIELYRDSTFYIPEEEQETVDLQKDEEYYGRIQKHN